LETTTAMMTIQTAQVSTIIIQTMTWATAIRMTIMAMIRTQTMITAMTMTTTITPMTVTAMGNSAGAVE
jgi:hypothetical protein